MKHAVNHTSATLKDPRAAVPHLSTSGSRCLVNQPNTPSASSLRYKQFTVSCLSQIVYVVMFPGCVGVLSVSSVCTCSYRAIWPPPNLLPVALCILESRASLHNGSWIDSSDYRSLQLCN